MPWKASQEALSPGHESPSCTFCSNTVLHKGEAAQWQQDRCMVKSLHQRQELQGSAA